jgi:TRAP-type C4-dicarboxylate transport system permease large subunit
LNPNIGPASDRFPWSERVRSLPAILGPLVIFVITIGGMLGGFFTPTEAGSVGTFAVIILCLLKRELSAAAFRKSLQEALKTSSMVLLLVAASLVLGHFITVTDISNNVAKWVVALPAITQLGFDPIWACIMVSMSVCFWSVLPPVAMPVFVVKNITKVPMDVIYSGIYPFLISLFVTLRCSSCSLR